MSVNLAWRIVVLLLLAQSTLALGQSLPDVYIYVRDDRIWLQPNDTARLPGGVLSGLAGIEALSSGGFLSRAGYEVAPGVILPGQSHDPFPFGGSSFLAEKPTQYSYGILGSENAIDIQEPTITAITYSGSFDTARSDLTVFLGVNGNPIPLSMELIPAPVLCAPANALLGDLDGNEKVGFADFLVLSGNFGKDVENYSEGDIDCNGKVEFADFLSLSGNFGKSLPAGAASVPEPSGIVLLALGCGLFGLVCRKSQAKTR